MAEWSGFRKKKDGPQQGTLFDVREVPSEPVNSPGMQKRGRRAEMVAAMPRTTALPFHADPDEPDFAREDPQFRSTTDKIRGRMDTDYGDEYSESELQATDSLGSRHRADMGRRLADRTTVPPESLEGLRGIEIGLDHFELESGKFDQEEAAHYDSRTREIRAPEPMHTSTLTHEIGHHVSLNQQGNRHGSRVQSSYGFDIDAAEEGRADAFQLGHTNMATHTYASNAVGTEVAENFTGDASPYRAAREEAGQPLRSFEGGEPLSQGQFAVQLHAFDPDSTKSKPEQSGPRRSRQGLRPANDLSQLDHDFSRAD